MSEPIKNVPRRVVTGHDANGVSVVLSDGIVPVHKFMPQDGVGFYEIWATDEMPAPVSATETGEVTELSRNTGAVRRMATSAGRDVALWNTSAPDLLTTTHQLFVSGSRWRRQLLL